MRRRAFVAAILLIQPVAPVIAEPAPSTGDSAVTDGLQPITVTAERLRLIGTASTASEGVVVNDELALSPVYRPGQLLETVPGLVVTVHSGEGKANQYLLRGYNLDHGTDLATFVDEIPVNQPTHAHGQGYTDMNFLIPELATNIHYTKGTYYAAEGDFASVGAIHVGYLDTVDDQLSVTGGMWGYQRLFAAGSAPLSSGNLLGAMELQHYDGPWTTPGDQRKINAVLRYSAGDGLDGYSLTGSFYRGLWNSQTDEPERAISEGLIGRFGELDPTDQGTAQRANLSGLFHSSLGDGRLEASGYVFNNQLSLFNNFTHVLTDPINGDQEDQHEERSTVGGGIRYTHAVPIAGIENELLLGVQSRYDFINVSRVPSKDAVPLPAIDDRLGFSERDRVRLASNAVYAQATTHWTDQVRTVVGFRDDYQYGNDTGSNPGRASRNIVEPKASLIIKPLETTEFYVSAGRGFHSDDLRGVNQARISAVSGAPLIATQMGEEIGLRQEMFERKVAMTLALFNLDAQSETEYDPDAGQDSAGPASRRYGYELNVTYQALRWLEFYATFSQNHSRFKTLFDDGTGHVGYYMPNDPLATGSVAVYVKNAGPWSGSLALRYLGAYPLSSDNVVKGSGYHEWNSDVRYTFGSGWSGAVGIYNLLNTRASAMQYWYIDRLPGEPAGGVADVHVHPLEPISFRITVVKRF